MKKTATCKGTATACQDYSIHPNFTEEQLGYLHELATRCGCTPADLVVAITLATCSEYSRYRAAITPGRGGWHSFIASARRFFVADARVPAIIFNDRFFEIQTRRAS